MKVILSENDSHKKPLFLMHLNNVQDKEKKNLIESDRSSNCSNTDSEDTHKEIIEIVSNKQDEKEKKYEKEIQNKLLPSMKYQNDLNYINSKQKTKSKHKDE